MITIEHDSGDEDSTPVPGIEMSRELARAIDLRLLVRAAVRKGLPALDAFIAADRAYAALDACEAAVYIGWATGRMRAP